MNKILNSKRNEMIPAERIMARLGYKLGKTPAGITAWQGEARLRGEQVKVLLMGAPGSGAPMSLTKPVWAGYYELGDGGEMLHDERFQTLAEYVTEQLLDHEGGKLLLYAKPQANCRSEDDETEHWVAEYARARCA